MISVSSGCQVLVLGKSPPVPGLAGLLDFRIPKCWPSQGRATGILRLGLYWVGSGMIHTPQRSSFKAPSSTQKTLHTASACQPKTQGSTNANARHVREVAATVASTETIHSKRWTAGVLTPWNPQLYIYPCVHLFHYKPSVRGGVLAHNPKPYARCL